MNVKIEIKVEAPARQKGASVDQVLCEKIAEQEAVLNALEREKSAAIKARDLLLSVQNEASRPRQI